MFQLSEISVRYGHREVLALERLDLDSRRFTVLLGHNGSGKSTLMGLLARQLSPSAGVLSLDDVGLFRYSHRRFAQKVAYLPQRLPEVPGMTVRELCGLGRFAWRGAIGRWNGADRAIIDDAIEETGLTAFSEHVVDQLSGGERQRAWIAMLLAQRAPILLLDEPISALDIAHQLELLELLRALNRNSGRGIVIILHDINLAARFADRILVLKSGNLAFDGTPDELLDPGRLFELFGTKVTLVDHPSRAGQIAVLA